MIGHIRVESSGGDRSYQGGELWRGDFGGDRSYQGGEL